MSQRMLHLMAPPDQERELTTRLRSSGFQVSASGRLAGGIHVRVRAGSTDEAEVDRIAAEVAPDARRGPAATPTHDLAGYREKI